MSIKSIDLKYEPKSEEAETEFCELYCNVLKNIYKISPSSFSYGIRRSLGNIRSYKNRELEKHESVSFENETDRIAYVYAYGIIHSVVVYNRFSDMLKNNPTLLKKIVTLEKIRLCALGGGPAFEVISICKILSSILANLRPDSLPPLQILVTIIDECGNWESDAKAIVQYAEQYLCDAQKIKVEFCYIEADLTSAFSEDVKTAIKKSHFVTMVKFISELHEASYGKLKIANVIHNIIETMSSKSYLFYLDTAGGQSFRNMDSMIDELSESARIYGPCLFNTHILNMDTVQLFSTELSRTLGDDFIHKCTSRISISCSAWKKVKDTLNLDEIYLNVLPHVHIDKPISVHVADRKLTKKKQRRFLKNA